METDPAIPTEPDPAEPVPTGPADAGAVPAPAPAPEPAPGEAAPAPKARKARRRGRRATAVPAWGVSLAVHMVFLGSLAAATFTTHGRNLIANLNSSLVASPKGGDAELTPIYADPSSQRSESAAGNVHAETAGGSGGASGGTGLGGIGSGPPSATPALGKVGRAGDGKGGTGLGGLRVAANVSGLSLLPPAPGVDLGGGGLVAGDVTYEATDIGASLDQIAREILRHLAKHKVTVVWLFDESESMKDDQKVIREKFDRVSTELKLNVDADKKSAGALNHAVVGFGQDIDYMLEKPTTDIDLIGRAIGRLRVDATGTENTMHAVADVIGHYGGLVRKDRTLLIVLVTDESGDDGAYVEEARQAVLSRGVPLYVIGRQSLFGYDRAHLLYVDPVTKEHYYPTIKRGPETADVETLLWDGFGFRQDEQPSGFAPYELARLTKASGGIYFLLPSEETMRVRQREKAYSIKALKEYIPDYESRSSYAERRNASELRRALHQVIQETKGYGTALGFPVYPDQLREAGGQAVEAATQRLAVLINIEKTLRSLEKNRDRETDKRWQAAYDLMLAQILAYEVKTYEYRACLAAIIKKPPKPSILPKPQLGVDWGIGHSGKRQAPESETAKKYAEADRLLKLVIERHPKTPWADLAQDTLARGLSADYHERHHAPPNPLYQERAKLVPKF